MAALLNFAFFNNANLRSVHANFTVPGVLRPLFIIAFGVRTDTAVVRMNTFILTSFSNEFLIKLFIKFLKLLHHKSISSLFGGIPVHNTVFSFTFDVFSVFGQLHYGSLRF